MSSLITNIYLLFIGAWLLLNLVTCVLVIILELQIVQILDTLSDVAKIKHPNSHGKEDMYD